MNTAKIETENFPFDQFKLLGLEKKDVLALPEPTLKALQSGNRTSLIQLTGFKIHENAEPVTLNAKLSLAQDETGKVSLRLHPVNLHPRNDLGLTDVEINHLKKDSLNLVPKLVADRKGNLTEAFIGLDHTTNEFVTVNREKIKAPEKINEIKLTTEQKRDFINGKPVQIGKDNFRLDIHSENGITDKNLFTLEFKKGKYTVNNALLDVVLLATGLAPIVLLEHLAKSLIRNVYGNAKSNADAVKQLMQTDLRPMLSKTITTIAAREGNGKHLSNTEKQHFLIVNTAEALESNKQGLDIKQTTAVGNEQSMKVIAKEITNGKQLPDDLKDRSISELQALVGDLEYEHADNGRADNYSTMNNISSEIEKIKEIIKQKEESQQTDLTNKYVTEINLAMQVPRELQFKPSYQIEDVIKDLKREGEAESLSGNNPAIEIISNKIDVLNSFINVRAHNLEGAAEKAGYAISNDKDGNMIFLVKKTDESGNDITKDDPINQATINKDAMSGQVSQETATKQIATVLSQQYIQSVSESQSQQMKM